MAEFPAGTEPGTWTPVAGGVGFQNSWNDSGHGDPCAYRFLPFSNEVEIIGDLSVPTFSSDSVIFTLPANLAPASNLQSFQPIVITSTGTVAVVSPRIYIGQSGALTAASASIPGASTGLTTRMAIRCLVSLDF